MATQTRRSGAISPDAAPDSGRLLRYLGRAAVVGALAVGLGGLGVSGLMMDRVDDIESENSAMASDLAALRAAAAPSGTSAIGELSAEMGRQRTALAVLGASDTARLNLQAQPAVEGANASYYWTPAGATGVLLCMNLPPPPAGMEYRIWMRDDGEMKDAGPLHVAGDGTCIAAVHLPEDGGVTDMSVTLESTTPPVPSAGGTTSVVAFAMASSTPEALPTP